jgi:hypothetical protein
MPGVHTPTHSRQCCSAHVASFKGLHLHPCPPPSCRGGVALQGQRLRLGPQWHTLEVCLDMCEGALQRTNTLPHSPSRYYIEINTAAAVPAHCVSPLSKCKPLHTHTHRCCRHTTAEDICTNNVHSRSLLMSCSPTSQAPKACLAAAATGEAW